MVSTRLRCVVTLTIFALLTLCQTGKVVAGASGAAGHQKHSLDTLPYTDSRRRWPFRLLLSFSSTSIGEKLKNLSPGKFFSRQKASFRAASLLRKQKKVDRFFRKNKVREVKAEDMFKSVEFEKWRKQAEAAAGRDSENLMFDTLYREFRDRDNGRFEAIIAQAMKDQETEGLALRFEDRLLDQWVDGLKNDDLQHIKKYMRYVQYRAPHEWSVHLRLQQKIKEKFMANRVAAYESAMKEILKKEINHY